MIKLPLLFLSCALVSSLASADLKINKKTVVYSDKGKNFEGYLISQDGSKKAMPGILMIPNWKGVTDETVHQAERFAKLGYTVFTADIYGQGVRPKDAKEAGTQATIYKTDRKLFRERLNLALAQLEKVSDIDKKKIAVVGYCFGGTGALELARSGAPVAAVVSFHGGLDSPVPADGKNIKAPVLALHGAIDPYVAPTDVAAFEEEMKTNKVDYQLIKYGGTVHSFTEVGAGTDITQGAAYNEASDKRSFQAAQDFLSDTLKTAKK